MRIEIPWTVDILIKDLVDLIRPHCKQIVIDGDRKVIIVEEPDEVLLDELEARGVKYVKV